MIIRSAMTKTSYAFVALFLMIFLASCVAQEPLETSAGLSLPFNTPTVKPEMSKDRRLPQLGRIMRECVGLPQNLSALDALATDGDDHAAYCLSLTHQVDDYKSYGQYWLGKLAKQGNAKAASEIAAIYLKAKDQRGIDWLLLAAYQHQKGTQFFLGTLAGAAWEKTGRSEYRELQQKWYRTSKIYDALADTRTSIELEVIATTLMPDDSPQMRQLMRDAYRITIK